MTEEYRKLKSFPSYRIYKDGRIYSEFINRFITPTEDTGKYLQNTLVDIHGNRKTVKTHRLVAMAFLPNPNNYIEVNHKDFNRKNNHVSNLEWCDRQYNVDYTIKYNLEGNKDTYSNLSPLSEEQVLLVPTMLAYQFSIKLISKLYGVGHMTIRNIVNKKTWKWLKLEFTKVPYNKGIIEIPKELYNELTKVGVDNTVLNSRVKVLESV